MKERALAYEDVSLVSRQISTIASRDDISVEVELFPGIKLTNPIIASPMKDVVNWQVAREMRRLGGFAILHRFCSIEEQVEEYLQAGECACAVGLDDNKRFDSLYNVGCRYFCLDVANGANVRNKDFIDRVGLNTAYWIVGNVVSKEGFQFCGRIGNQRTVYGCRVGISGGSACSSRSATGIFHPAISLIKECESYQSIYNMKIIADGGIKRPLDLCKSLIFGASAVMCGSLIAATKESPAEIIEKDGCLVKVLHGSASFEIQKTYKETPRYIEGKRIHIPYSGESLEELMTRFLAGLKSSMSYFNAKNLAEYRKNLDYVLL